MSRITDRFAALRRDGRTALVPYVTAGDPRPEVTVPLMHAMVEAGADLLELGVPFSDPMADGPVIQLANERALEHHTSLHDVLDMVRAFRQQDTATPVIVMGYLNPIEVMGYAEFATAAAAAGVDGVITVDMPPEEAEDFRRELLAQGIDPIFLLAPTTNDARIRKVIDAASGFIYYVALKGVTGAGNLDTEEVGRRVSHIRAMTDIPVGVGFGIKDADSARAVAPFADAVVVGSAIVRQIEQYSDKMDTATQHIVALLKDIRQALDSGDTARLEQA
ncbi:MAG TPA: tryptophan synthase subunit alpha [Gammaproteobacteria bacterium]|nr:tryptophan synthase subunit alpha [Gammaproteobacteria bacterium]